MFSGWIKLHRKLTDWEWYSDQNTTRLFIHLLLKAQHSDSKFQGHIIPAGSLKTGRIQLSDETGLSQQQIRTSLKKLKSTDEITIKTTNKYSIISINNWIDHQESNQQNNHQITSNQPSNNHQITTCKNDKNEENDKKVSRFTPPDIHEVTEYCKSYAQKKSKAPIDPEAWVDHYKSKGWMIGKNKMKDWKASVRTWYKDQPIVKNIGSDGSERVLL